MKRIILLLAISIFSNQIISQQSKDSISIKDLLIPNSPALMLLDKAPTSIENPSNTKALIVSLANSIDNDAKLPMNFGLEFSPFWIYRTSNMNIYKYSGIHEEENNFQSKIFAGLKNTSISIGFSSSKDTLSNLDVTNFSYGARTNLITIRQKDYSKRIKAEVEKINLEQDKFLNYTDRPIYDPNIETYEEFRVKDKKWFDKNVKKIKSNKPKLNEIINENALFLFSIAYAKNFVFENNDFSTRRFGRSAIWGTASSSIKTGKKNYLNLYIMSRYINDADEILETEVEKLSKFDIGSKIEFEFPNIILSYEYIHRDKDDKSNTKRSSGLIRYKLNDNLAITGSFGRNFGDQDNLISLLGLNWGFQNSGQSHTEIKK